MFENKLIFFLLSVDYDEKAEDAIDYEDIDEQYDGPEIQSSTEEDHLLPKKDYFSSDALLASLDHKGSVFDEENYDEDEETIKGIDVVENNIEVKISPSAGCAFVYQCYSISSTPQPHPILPHQNYLRLLTLLHNCKCLKFLYAYVNDTVNENRLSWSCFSKKEAITII